MCVALLSPGGEEIDDDDGEQHHKQHGGSHDAGPASGPLNLPPHHGPAACPLVLPGTRLLPPGPSSVPADGRQPDVQRVADRPRGQRRAPLVGPLDLQTTLAATEADAVGTLHGSRQVGEHGGVRCQLGQPEVGERSVTAAQRTLDRVGLGRLDVHACQALQAEGVLAAEHLGCAEDVVELAEADGALQVWGILVDHSGRLDI